MSDMQQVVIVGGGMVGVSLALLLSRAGLPIQTTLIEQFPLSQQKPQSPSFDERTTALSAGSAGIFQQMGCWSDVQALCEPIHQVHVSDRGHFGGARLQAEDYGIEALGYVVPNRVLGQILLEHLQQSSIEVLAPTTVAHCQPCKQGYRLRLSDDKETELKADVLIVADGADSGLARQLGIGITTHDYQQQAMIANVALARSHRGVAYERFTEQGPMALLPLPDLDYEHRAALVWTLPKEKQAEVGAWDDASVLAHLQQRFGYRAGEITRLGERQYYPLQLVQAEEQVRSHLVLVGNAAHLLHPAAGQGFNLSLRDCAQLVAVFRRAADSQQPLGALSVLSDYVAQRGHDQLATIHLTDQMVNRFSSQGMGNTLLRQLGLLGLNVLPSAKDFFARQMMGVL